MTDKLDYYDILSTLILGILLLSWVLLCFPILLTLPLPLYPEAFSVVVLTALSIFLGQLIQALASLLELYLFWSFGGRPSDVALARGQDQYLPEDTAKRIKAKLQAATAQDTSDHSLFVFAMQCSESAGVARVTRFNSLYAYHRGLIILTTLALIVFLASVRWGTAAMWSLPQVMAAIILLAVTLVLTWYRTKQRGWYYVRAVLLAAERFLEEHSLESATSAGAERGKVGSR